MMIIDHPHIQEKSFHSLTSLPCPKSVSQKSSANNTTHPPPKSNNSCAKPSLNSASPIPSKPQIHPSPIPSPPLTSNRFGPLLRPTSKSSSSSLLGPLFPPGFEHNISPLIKLAHEKKRSKCILKKRLNNTTKSFPLIP